jgi:hypothetical protein
MTSHNIYEIAERAKPYLTKWLAENSWSFKLEEPLKTTWVDFIPTLPVYDIERVRKEASTEFQEKYKSSSVNTLLTMFLWELGYQQLTSEFWKNEFREFHSIVSDMQRSRIKFCIMHHEEGCYSIWRTNMLNY